MKNYILIIFILITQSNLFSQTTQRFTKQFETKSGIYGSVKVSARPTTVGFAYIWIQQDNITVNGIRTAQGNFSGNDLSAFGINFPFNCSNCYFYAKGTASMQVYNWQNRDLGNFKTGGSINNGGVGKTNQSVLFSENAKQRHNKARSEGHGSAWERTGRVENITINGVAGGDFGKITRAIEKYVKATKKKENYKKYIKKAEWANSDTEKLRYLNQAKQYTDDTTEVDYKIAMINKKIIENQQGNSGIVIKENKADDKNTSSSKDDDDDTDKTNSTKNYNSYNTPTYQQTFSQKMDNMVLSSANTSEADKSAYRNYMVKRDKIQAKSNARYQKKAAEVKMYTDLAVGLVNYFSQRAAENRRSAALARERVREEKARKRSFEREASKYRYEIKKNIKNRNKLFTTNTQQETTYNLDGTDFNPIFIYYAYTKKGYDYYYENVKYPNSMEFKMQETARVYFSPVFGVFPNSNGTYPFLSDIKKQIINEHFPYSESHYDIRFFKRETSVDWVINSLKKNLNKTVNEYGFTNAKPSSKNSIVFLNNKMTANNSKDYWTGKKVKKKVTKDVDYFKSEKKTAKKKVDYWGASKIKKSKTTKKKVTTKKKNPNYWDN